MKFGAFLIPMLALAKYLDAPAVNADPASVPSATNATARATPTFEVKGYEIRGNTVLSYDQMEPIFKKHVGPGLKLDDIREALREFQLAYRDRGFVTVSVALPRQQITNGLVKVQVTEGKLAQISVTGNHFYNSNNIRRALPSLTTNVLLNTKWFQTELDQANANQDRQIYPVIAPGLDPGTTALTLKVKDRLPLHGHLEINNKATPDTPPLRLDSAIQYNNLWQLEHQVGLQYNFSPEEMKSADEMPRFWDQPTVASASAFYRIPLNFGAELRDVYDRMPVDFGYDQVTRTFRLPPPTGKPEFIAYGSHSSSETPVRFGPLTVLTNTTLADITSQFAQSDLTDNNNVGGKFTLPLRQFAGIQSSLIFGVDYKTYAAQTFSTNLTYFNLYSIDTFGNRVLERQDTIPLDSNSRVSLDYIPLSLGWSASRPDKSGSSSFSFNQNIFLSRLASDRENFQIVAGSQEAGGNYTTLNSSFTREQRIGRDWSVLFRASGQWASSPLIGNEQFALGGTAGVRGYEEGQVYGDSGWRSQFDLRAPPVNIGYLPYNDSDIPVYLRGSWFMDFGQAFLLDRPELPRHSENQWGTGIGFYATAGQHFDARLTLGWALLNTPRSEAGTLRAYFSIGVQF